METKQTVTHPNSSNTQNPASFRPGERQNQANSTPNGKVEELLTLAEVATYLKLSRRTAWRWCKQGDLPAIKVGHQWRVARSDLENFVHRRGKLGL
ncbi:MAG: helix-turn-helix domain-containing protein [Anaerolineales bacterium]|nr:helix-turn-helix domain-containing protein [Anaerolineales bacterium]